MKFAVCDENHTSSSDDDHFPILPPTSSSSSSSLSPIEEENNSTSISTVSTHNSKYLSSYCNSSVTSLSSDDEFERYKELHEKCEHIEKRTESHGHCSKDTASTSESKIVINIPPALKFDRSTQCDDISQGDDHQRHSIVVSEILFIKF